MRGGNGAAVNGSGSMTGWGQIATSQHHFVQETNNALDLGSAAKGWRNVYRLIKLQRELQRFANEPKQHNKKLKDAK